MCHDNSKCEVPFPEGEILTQKYRFFQATLFYDRKIIWIKLVLDFNPPIFGKTLWMAEEEM